MVFGSATIIVVVSTGVSSLPARVMAAALVLAQCVWTGVIWRRHVRLRRLHRDLAGLQLERRQAIGVLALYALADGRHDRSEVAADLDITATELDTILDQLARAGLVRDSWTEQPDGPPRRTCRLTAAGEGFLSRTLR
jgi:hypothetical protein